MGGKAQDVREVRLMAMIHGHFLWFLMVLVAGLGANVLIPLVYIFAITALVLAFWHNPQTILR